MSTPRSSRVSGTSSSSFGAIGRKLRTLSRLGPGDLLRILVCAGFLPPVSWSLRWAGFTRTFRLLEWTSPSPVPANDPAQPLRRARSWGQALEIVGRNLPVRGKCLERSLTLWWILRWRGVATELRLGVRKSAPSYKERGHKEPGLEAHAWLERDGQVLYDRPNVGELFAPFEDEIHAGGQAPRSLGAAEAGETTKEATVSGPR